MPVRTACVALALCYATALLGAANASPRLSNLAVSAENLAFTAGTPQTSQPIVIDLSTADVVTKLAAQVCVGLFNRDGASSRGAYALIEAVDADWLADIEGIRDPTLHSVADFLELCLHGPNPVARGFLRYNYTAQKELVPNIITVAAVLDAVPLEDGHPAITGANILFDANVVFAGFKPLDATSYTFNQYANITTGISKMNPGYSKSKTHPFNPPLTRDANSGLVDYIVKERLFNFFLWNGCIPGTEEYVLQKRMVSDPSTAWKKPLDVMGYDDSWPIAGDLFEAETDCNKEHNMGQIASNGVPNLSFFSRKAKVGSPMLQNIAPAPGYNKSKTYIGIVVGDGDNIAFIRTSRRRWFMDRAARWYYNNSYASKHDYFVLPPSGDLYAYPAMMPEDMQANFMSNTERDCVLLNTSASVTWEWFDTWSTAIKHVYPKYAKQNTVRGLFAVNVPYMFPVLNFGPKEHYKILGGKVVLFKPREWRGPACTPKSACPTAHELAAEINGYPKGTVSHIYVTSDGGGNLGDIYDMVAALDEHVEVSNHEMLVQAALQRG
eukprot:gene5561-6746_t